MRLPSCGARGSGVATGDSTSSAHSFNTIQIEKPQLIVITCGSPTSDPSCEKVKLNLTTGSATKRHTSLVQLGVSR